MGVAVCEAEEPESAVAALEAVPAELEAELASEPDVQPTMPIANAAETATADAAAAVLL